MSQWRAALQRTKEAMAPQCNGDGWCPPLLVNAWCAASHLSSQIYVASTRAYALPTRLTQPRSTCDRNEWSEGAYLEPDERYGYGRLEAIKQVFGVGE